jgi:L-alanine-DL-glutamate epimerase-like enolase superfamily enzyme
VAAISAVDIALWDILGKSLGRRSGACSAAARPTGCRPMLRAAGRAPTRSASSCSYIAKGGFKAVKMRVGAMDGAPHISARRVKAAREALGPDIDLMVDAHGTYTVADAQSASRSSWSRIATSPGSRNP